MYIDQTDEMSKLVVGQSKHAIDSLFGASWVKGMYGLLAVGIGSSFGGCGGVVPKPEELTPMIYLCILMLTDFLTGTLRASRDPFDEITSSRARQGVIKMALYLLLLVVSLYSFNGMAKEFHIGYLKKIPVILCIYMCISEFMSILENARGCGIPLPSPKEIPGLIRDFKNGKIDWTKYTAGGRNFKRDTLEFKRKVGWVAIERAFGKVEKLIMRKDYKLSVDVIKSDIRNSFEISGTILGITPECIGIVWNGLESTLNETWKQVDTVINDIGHEKIIRRQIVNILLAAADNLKNDISYLTESFFRFKSGDKTYLVVHNNRNNTH